MHDIIFGGASLSQSWTRDPFDRIITGQAQMNGLRLLTKDETIIRHYTKAFWS